MITAGLELINFIDPTLTWTTLSKKRNTTRRSRKPVSSTLKLDKDQEKKKKNLKRSSGTESDKSDLSFQEQGFGNMEHMPIKKRRFILRSPSPTPQSPNCEDSQELDSGSCTLDRKTCSNENIEQDAPGTCFSKPVLEKCGMDGVVENTASSFGEVLVSGEDFPGVAILAVAACSDVDCIVGDIEKSKMGDLLKRKYNEPVASTTDMKESIAISGTADCLEMSMGLLMEDERMADCPSNSIQNDCLKNVTEICEPPRVETNESVLSAINQAESIECCESPTDLTNNNIKIADKAAKISGAPKNYRLHWDLNLLMDEWDYPIDDTFEDSCMGSMAVASTSAMNFQKPENVEASSLTSPEIPLATESGDQPNSQSVAFSVPSSKTLLDESSDLVTGSFMGTCSFHGANSNAMESTSNGVVELIQQNTSVSEADSNFVHSLFLGMKGTNNLVSFKVNDTSDAKLIKVAEEGSRSTLQTKVTANDFSLTALSENASCDVKGVHCGPSDSKERNDLDEKESDIICRLVPTNSEPLEYKNSLDAKENKSLDALSLSAKSNFEVPMIELKDSNGSHCLSTLEVFVAPLATFVNKQAMNTVIAKEVEENSSTPDASRCDNLMEVVPNVTEALMQVNPTGNNANVASVERGYDSYLEDRELRESVRHCWEDNEGEDAEIEHVDYDSDNNEDIFFETVDDDVQQSREVLSEDCEKQNYHLEKCEQNLSIRLFENCSLQDHNCLLTVDAKGAKNLKLESPMLKACYATHLKMEDRVEGDSKDSWKSDLETDRSGNEYDNDTSGNCRGASSSGRELQFSDRSANSIRSSSNFDNIHQADCSGESVAKRQPPLMQTDWFVGRSGNVELKSVFPDSLPEEGGERIARVSEDNTPTSVCGPRIISTSQSVYNPMRRGPPGERNNDCGKETVKGEDFTLDSNPRNKFDRCFNVINRGFREGYSKPGMYEGGKTNGPMLTHFENRIDSHFPQTQEKSRSRSRSRTPDFRCHTRMGRARSPYQPPSHTRERRSPVKSFNQRQRFDIMGSPGRLRSDDCIRPMMRPARFNNTTFSRDPECEGNYYRKKPFVMHGNKRPRSRSRSYSPDFRPDSRIGAVRPPHQPRGGHVRERGSPMRVFRPRQRYDKGNQPMMQTGRFNYTHSDRGNDYNNGADEYRVKPQNIVERIHPGRQNDQYDETDNLGGRNFQGNQNYVRGDGCGDRGGGYRRQGEFMREGRGIRYNNNNNNNSSHRLFYSGPKQFEGGMRDYAKDMLPSGVRP